MYTTCLCFKMRFTLNDLLRSKRVAILCVNLRYNKDGCADRKKKPLLFFTWNFVM